MEHAPALFRFLIKCPLVEVRLIARAIKVPYITMVAEFFYSALATHGSHSSLQKITVECGRWNLQTMNTDQLGIYSVGERSFDLSCLSETLSNYIYHTDDVVVRDMAGAWPCIESLRLSPGHSYRFGSVPRVTLDGVYAFAKHCPLLKDLNITFDATVAPEINAQNKASQKSLNQLDVAYSHIRKSRPVAKFLLKIFPEMESIQTLHEQLGDKIAHPQVLTSYKRWKKVEEALWDFRDSVDSSGR
ncbi:hypothetical protein B0H19DRAFT_495751 [Mycena capillaripes]|nr:hypothetical protein B0H19DRAFT_495751 [Mycena capillaripes]